MRIIAGKYKGKKLFQPLNKKTRPLKDLVKESIFNIIEHSNKINVKIENSKVLDLFAGSGSFGIECISRNVSTVFFVEKYINALRILIQNLDVITKHDDYKIYEQDCLEFLASENLIVKDFNIIFLDPPFKDDQVLKILNLIYEKNILDDSGIIIIHRHIKEKLELFDKFKIIEERKYGISKIFFVKKI